MSVERLLFWQQGLFLQPQHFQLMEQSFRELLTPLKRFMIPHFWGVISLKIKETRLAGRILEVQNGTFIFPDGTHVVFPGNAVMNVRSLDDAHAGSLNVYLGLKSWYHSGENVTVVENLEDLSGVTTRFVATTDSEEVDDLHAGGPVGHIKKLHYVLKLFWEHELEQSGDYHLIQIARFEKRGASINLSQDYIPPCPMISGSESLLNLIGEIRDQITARSRQLEEYKKKRGVHSAEFGSRDMVYILALRSLNRYVPLLHHYTQTPTIHPWIVYGALRQLIGELSSFSDRVNSLGEFPDHDHASPSYDHSRLWDCYYEIQNLISHLLDEITAGPEYIMSFIRDGVFYGADLKPVVFKENNRFYLSVRTDDEASSVIQTVSTLAKLGSREDLKHIVARALPGIHLEHQPQPPQQLPRRSNAIYFLIHHHSEQWESVVKNRNIALYWNNAPGDADIELVVIRRSHAPK